MGFKFTKHIAQLLDLKLLRQVILAEESDFNRYGAVQGSGITKRIFIDRGAKVLAVAHLDTVRSVAKQCEIVDKIGMVKSGRLDDRLGAYVILHLLPKLGIKTDVLLTTGEESGQSSAEHFKAPRQYNWGFSFDRRGTDVVTYQYRSEAWETALEMAGWEIGAGSFSDISTLDIGARCANFGVGYHGEHGDDCHCYLGDLVHNVSRFAAFYLRQKDQKWPYNAYNDDRYWGHDDYTWNGWRNYSQFRKDYRRGKLLALPEPEVVYEPIYGTSHCAEPDRQGEHDEAWENGEPCWVCGRTQYEMLQEQRALLGEDLQK